ncbi:MAG: enoyl-CoA hydratase/isomerase family protein [Betaproteobacteria bacterium]|nr:enoyl-CoA hydratase/isomerase family protein [Betaproteobacteria bacterium]
MESDRQLVLTRSEERGAAGRVAYVTVNNPDQRNALGRRGKEELIAAFEALARDEQLRVAVLTGAGEKSFIAGANLKEMSEVGWRDAEDISTKTHLACDAIRCLPVPVIARVNGYCLGAGMEIAASCDMRVGVDTAKFGMPEVKFGIPSGMEACLLPGLIGWGKTRELVFTGETIDAQEAYRCGFLDRLVTPPELDAAVEKWVAAILDAGPGAIRIQKRLVQDWERMPIVDAVKQGIAAVVEARKTDEPRRLMEAFVNRRKGKA